ncbi:MAG TPA: endonuclease/exonuclease/phosphatase family protein [Candidatus Sulfotelmatobacter sp.]|nr:endonuclease/exonuclease/phosphatase family protein [Candidatus Sulfotelmatobacter sp.]
MNTPLFTARVLWAGLLVLCLCNGQSARSQEPAPGFRVMTYNIHHGEGLDRKVDLERIAALIKREQADIVALQEVDKGVERTARRDLPAELAALSGMTCLFSNNYHYQGGEYGNAVLTRFPVKQWTNTHYKMLRPGEQRGLLQAVLTVQGRELVFFDTHVDFHPDDTERLLNVGEIHNRLPQYRPRPVLLCGDFNDTPQSRTYTKTAEQFIDSWTVAGTGNEMTIPASNPKKRIDYIWISKDSPLVPLKAWVPQSEASDHLPVVAEFRWR